MSLYELLLFLHILAAIVWIGSGTLLNVLAYRARSANDNEALGRIASEAAGLSNKLFLPASLATLVFGVLVVIEGDLSFGDLWVVLGLVGIAATIVTGAAIIGPRSGEISGMLERDGVTPEAGTKITQLLTLGRIDLVVLYLVVADMVLKPTGDDVGVLIAMAVILIAAIAFFTSQARAAGETSAPQPGQASPAG
jgi:uncharacterized membrane protein